MGRVEGTYAELGPAATNLDNLNRRYELGFAAYLKTILKSRPMIKWSRKVGIVAFLFFLIKGLAWLAIPFVLTRVVTP